MIVQPQIEAAFAHLCLCPKYTLLSAGKTLLGSLTRGCDDIDFVYYNEGVAIVNAKFQIRQRRYHQCSKPPL